MKANCYKPPSDDPTPAQIAKMCEKIRKERTNIRCDNTLTSKTKNPAIKRYHVSMSRSAIDGLISANCG